MKKTFIAVTVSTLLIASQAQAFYFTVPMAIGAAIGASTGAQLHTNRSIAQQNKRLAAVQYITDKNSMTEVEAQAKNCLMDATGAPCTEFLSTFDPYTPREYYAAEVAERWGDLCDKRTWVIGFEGLTPSVCERLGHPDENFPVTENDDTAAFDVQDGNWD